MVNVKAINDERLGRWKVQLNRRHATPIVLMGVGHDHNNGQIITLCTEDRTDEELLLFLMEAVRELQKSITEKN